MTNNIGKSPKINVFCAIKLDLQSQKRFEMQQGKNMSAANLVVFRIRKAKIDFLVNYVTSYAKRLNKFSEIDFYQNCIQKADKETEKTAKMEKLDISRLA